MLYKICVLVIFHIFYVNQIDAFADNTTECASPAFKGNSASPDIYSTVYTCIANITDALMPPSYLYLTSTVETYISIQVNSLIKLDELEETATMDLFFRVYWEDPRMHMPGLWDILNITSPDLLEVGIDLTQLIRNQDSPLNVWLPDLYMVNIKDSMWLDETIRMQPGGVFFWSRHVVATIAQSQFDYSDYPDDAQLIQIGIQSYGFKTNYVNLSFTDSSKSDDFTLTNFYPPVVVAAHNADDDTVDDGVSTVFNPLWKFDYAYYSVIDFNATQATFSEALVTLQISRESTGITYRLALPIMLLLMLAGLTFWSDYTQRVDTTITLLLSISALYIVIFSSIPMLGYLTKFDKYIIGMFIMIVFAVCVHQLCTRLIIKAETLPLRFLMARTLELIGKVVILPIVVLVFVFTFNDIHIENLGKKATKRIYTMFAFIFAGVVFMRELKGYTNSCKVVQQKIRNKIDNPTGYSLSSLEVLYYNISVFGVCSRSAAYYHRWKKENDKQFHIEDISNVHSGRDSKGSERDSPSSYRVSLNDGGGSVNGIQLSSSIGRAGNGAGTLPTDRRDLRNSLESDDEADMPSFSKNSNSDSIICTAANSMHQL